jgi:hypothetical protein
MELYRITFDYFEKEVEKAFEIKLLKRIPVLGLPLVKKIPLINKYFTFACEMHVYNTSQLARSLSRLK